MTVVSLRLHDFINVDGVSYLRHARYLADGQWTLGASGYWSPLLSWLIAPWLRAGVDSLIAARIVLVLGGALFLIGAWQLMQRLISPREWGRRSVRGVPTSVPARAMMSVLAIDAVPWTVVITPDLLVAGCLLMYCAQSLRPDFAERPAVAFRAGLIAGVAYLAKAYALPFFVVHFLFALSLSAMAIRMQQPVGAPRRSVRRLIGTAAAGFLGCALVAGPWIAVISTKYGSLTPTTAAAYNYAKTNPAIGERPQFEDVLISPAAGRLTIWETPDALAFRGWLPTASWANLKHEAHVAWNSLATYAHCVDILRLTGLLLLISPVLMIALRREPAALRRWIWAVGTIGIYCAGYLFVLVERRYIMPMVLPIGLFLCAAAADLAAERWRGRWPPLRWLVSRPAAVVLVCSFAYWGPRDGVPAVLAGVPPIYRDLGDRLKSRNGSGRVAGNHFRAGLYVAYHAGLPYAGNLIASTPEELDRALRANDVRVFVYSQGDEEPKPSGSLPPSGWAVVPVRAPRSIGLRMAMFVRTDAR